MKNKAIFALKAAVVAAITAGVVTSGFEIKETKATLTAPTGKCGALLTAYNAGLNSRLSTWTDVAISTVAVFDFDARTVSFDGVDESNYGSSGAVSSASSGSSTFTIAPGTFAGSYVLTFATGSSMNLVSTNSGNTILMADAVSGSSTANMQSGVCQAL